MRKVFMINCAALLVAGLAAGVALAAEGTATLCRAGEYVVFDGAAEKGRVSVCASPEFGPDKGYLQLRQGASAEAPTLAVPEKETTPAKAAQSGLWSFSGGGGAYLRFADGPSAAWYVYTAIGKFGPGPDPVEKAGLAREENGQVSKDIALKPPVVSELGPEFFEKAGLSESEADFELPE